MGVVWAWLSHRSALALTIENRLSAFENRLSAFENRQSKIRYRKSTIENRKSKIGYRKSTIENRKLKNRIYRLFRSKINERLSIIGYRYFCPLWRSIMEYYVRQKCGTIIMEYYVRQKCGTIIGLTLSIFGPQCPILGL